MATVDWYSLHLPASRVGLTFWKELYLRLNPAKCKTITFTLYSRSTSIITSYTLDGHQLERCASVRDLGVILSPVHTASVMAP